MPGGLLLSSRVWAAFAVPALICTRLGGPRRQDLAPSWTGSKEGPLALVLGLSRGGRAYSLGSAAGDLEAIRRVTIQEMDPAEEDLQPGGPFLSARLSSKLDVRVA